MVNTKGYNSFDFFHKTFNVLLVYFRMEQNND